MINIKKIAPTQIALLVFASISMFASFVTSLQFSKDLHFIMLLISIALISLSYIFFMMAITYNKLK